MLEMQERAANPGWMSWAIYFGMKAVQAKLSSCSGIIPQLMGNDLARDVTLLSRYP